MTVRVLLLSLTVLAMGGWLLPALRAQDAASPASENAADAAPEAEAKAADSKADDAAEGAKAKTPAKKKLPEFEKVIEGMEAVPVTGGEKGLMALYRYPETERAEDQSKLLCRIPASLIDQDMLIALSVSRGLLAGFQWGDSLVRWRLVGKKVVLEAPDSRYVTDGDSPFAEAIRRTYRPTIVASLPIVTMVGGDPVVDLGELLTDKPGRMPGAAGNPDRSLSQYNKIKVFPDNILIDVDLAAKSGDNYELVGITYAFRRLPKTPTFKGRAADERVGYFNVARQNWTLPHDAKETVQRYVHRWDLQKADPSLELSPPKKPIVFIIEDTVPIRWRHYVQAGVAEWNTAFEKLGFVNAIVVQQQTRDNTFADFDPEDARYNFIRWISIGNPFALGPRRVDPRSGEILDADVIIDDSFLRAYQLQLEQFLTGQIEGDPAPEVAAIERAYPGFELRTEPAAHDHDHAGPAIDEQMLGEMPDFVQAISRVSRLDDAAIGRMPGSRCEMSFGFQHQLALAQLAMVNADGAGGRVIPDRLLGEVIKKIVTHEVGHALGLRHNFKGSAWLDLQEIRRRRDAGDEPTAASVMDYAPLLIFKGDKLEDLRHITDPGIGPYDEWAIEYGYRIADAGDGGEAKMLSAIARRNTEKPLHYATDEDSFWINMPDPSVYRWDMADNPVDWFDSRIELTDQLIANVREWALDDDDPAYYLRSTFNTLLRERMSAGGQVGHFVTGQYFSRNRFSDPNATDAFVLIDPDKQRAAVKHLGQTLFSDSFYDFDPTIYNDLSPVRWKDWATRSVTRLDYPLHQIILEMQSPSLASLIAPPSLQRLYDSQLKTTAKNKLTVAELLTTTRDMIWSELDNVGGRAYTDAEPLVSSIRRNLQDQHLDLLLAWAEPGLRYYGSPDLHRMTRFAARELGDRIAKVLDQHEGKLDFASRAHLVEARSRIERILEAQYSAR